MPNDLTHAVGPACPHCGCNDCKILKHPDTSSSWFRANGRGQCSHCGRVFRVSAVADTTTPPIGFQAPIMDGERAEPEPVRYQVLECPRCSADLKVASTKPVKGRSPLRQMKCKSCGFTCKLTEKREKPTV